MDENNPAMPAPERKAPRKKKVRRVSKSTKAAPAKAVKGRTRAPSAGPSSGVLIAVYVLLGLLVIGTSFYAGYLVGQNSAGGPSTGGTVKLGAVDKLDIIAYSDYECPFCSRVEPTLAQLKTTYGNKINMVFKNFPLESIHPNALNAAIAAECVRKMDEDKFWAYHDKLFANQAALGVAQLKQYAADLGLDTAKFNSCLDNKETEGVVRADMQEASARGVQGTPSFWIRDELVVGALPYNDFKTKVDAKLSGQAAPAPAAPTPSAPAAPSAPVDVAAGKNIVGDKDAKVMIVEFTDYQCPFCKRHFDQTEAQIMDTYVKTGKAQYAVRHFPLSFHAQAVKAAEAAECAADQGKFWEMHATLFKNGQGDGTGLAIADLKKYAGELKLDTAKFNSCLDSGEKNSIVLKDQADGSAAGVSGTPSFYVNGVQLVGAQPFSSFKPVIDAALAK